MYVWLLRGTVEIYKTLKPSLVDQSEKLQVDNILGIANPGGVKGVQTYFSKGSSQTVVP